MTVYELIFQSTDNDTWDALKDSEWHEERLLSLKELECDTPCGSACRDCIDIARMLLSKFSDASQDDQDVTEAIWRRVVTTCSVYFNG